MDDYLADFKFNGQFNSDRRLFNQIRFTPSNIGNQGLQYYQEDSTEINNSMRNKNITPRTAILFKISLI